jgi:hypothetical protein
MCGADLWELQNLEEQRQDIGYNDNDDDEPFDSGVFTKKKNTNIIKVKKASPNSRY